MDLVLFIYRWISTFPAAVLVEAVLFTQFDTFGFLPNLTPLVKIVGLFLGCSILSHLFACVLVSQHPATAVTLALLYTLRSCTMKPSALPILPRIAQGLLYFLVIFFWIVFVVLCGEESYPATSLLQQGITSKTF